MGLAGIYYRRDFICPYYFTNSKGKIRCEGGLLCFTKKCVTDEYIKEFCGSYDYKKCSMAAALDKYYENAKDIKIPKRKRMKLGDV